MVAAARHVVGGKGVLCRDIWSVPPLAANAASWLTRPSADPGAPTPGPAGRWGSADPVRGARSIGAAGAETEVATPCAAATTTRRGVASLTPCASQPPKSPEDRTMRRGMACSTAAPQPGGEWLLGLTYCAGGAAEAYWGCVPAPLSGADVRAMAPGAVAAEAAPSLGATRSIGAGVGGGLSVRGVARNCAGDSTATGLCEDAGVRCNTPGTTTP